MFVGIWTRNVAVLDTWIRRLSERRIRPKVLFVQAAQLERGLETELAARMLATALVIATSQPCIVLSPEKRQQTRWARSKNS